MSLEGRGSEPDTIRPRQVACLASALQDAVVSRTDPNASSAVDGRMGAPGLSPVEKPSAVALAAKATMALVIFCVLEFVLFQASTSHQSLLWTMLLRGVPSAAGGITVIGPGIWARGRGWRVYLRAGLLLLVLFDAVDLAIALLYGWGQAVV
jgi:hypothetical protein